MATSYLSPGVYIEEVDRGSKPIEAVGTSTAAFIGESSVGPTNEAVLCTNWAQYTRTFGDFSHSTFLAHAVYGFFNNGGTKAFVCNVAPKTVTAEQAAKEAEKKETEAKKATETGKPVAAAAPALAPGPAAPNPALYIGKDEGPGRRTGLNVFNDISEINLVAAPGQADPAIQDAVISHCENNKYRFAILDSAEELGKDGIAKMPKPRDSQYAAYYFPWIQLYDPEKGNIFVPPSGHMAGIYARSDEERGVHHAAAAEVDRGQLRLRYHREAGGIRHLPHRPDGGPGEVAAVEPGGPGGDLPVNFEVQTHPEGGDRGGSQWHWIEARSAARRKLPGATTCSSSASWC